jgi:hypothetical protein
VRLTHVRRRRVTINVHGGANVRVPHEFLLDSYWSAYRVYPHPVGAPECVRADVSDAGCLASPINDMTGNTYSTKAPDWRN